MMSWRRPLAVAALRRRPLMDSTTIPFPAVEDHVLRPEDTLRAAGISTTRHARCQRRMSRLLAG